ncbi:MAG: hypothetical protein ABW185_03320 [Sedimenticola sp.]
MRPLALTVPLLVDHLLDLNSPGFRKLNPGYALFDALDECCNCGNSAQVSRCPFRGGSRLKSSLTPTSALGRLETPELTQWLEKFHSFSSATKRIIWIEKYCPQLHPLAWNQTSTSAVTGALIVSAANEVCTRDYGIVRR